MRPVAMSTRHRAIWQRCNVQAFLDLTGKKGLIVGIATEQSIAYHCACVFRQLGAQLAITYRNDKDEAEVRKLALPLEPSLIAPLDVRDDAQIARLFQQLHKQWGAMDFLVHAVAFAPRQDLEGRFTDTTRRGFSCAMETSVFSLIRLSQQAAPLMCANGGCILTFSYLGAHKVVDNYRLMGPVKAALESSVNYLAAELGAHQIRVHALSPGPMRTRAASGLAHFDALLFRAAQASPEHRLATVEDVAATAAFLVSDRAKTLTGNLIYVDAGCHIVT